MVDNSTVLCVGELLIDMFCTDVKVELENGENFKKMAGGAPANVAATIARLGGSASFAGNVGNDSFGKFLIKTLEQFKVDTSMITKDEEFPTTIAFVSLTTGGERDFQFNRGADKNLEMNDLFMDKIMKSKIVHFGSATAFLEGSLQDTYFTLMEKVDEAGVHVSFDPNFRQDLWKGSESEFVRLSKQAVSHADFVKVSAEELILITGEENAAQGIKKLHAWGARLVAVTMGESGTVISNQKRQEIVPSISVHSIDTTGAGDAFVGAMLYQLALLPTEKIDFDDFLHIKRIVYFANRVGANVCKKVGSMTALPTIDDLR